MNQQGDMGEAELRMVLRGLRREMEPGHDLWPGIAARLQVQPQKVTLRRHQRWPLAWAAAVLLVLGVAWQGNAPQAVQPAPANPLRVATGASLPKEAETLTVHYQAARRELDVHPAPASWQVGLAALDHSADQILVALRQNPDSPLLLEQLRQIYARRIALSRRALFA